MRYSPLLLSLACMGNEKITSAEDGLLADSDRPAWDPDPQTISNSSSNSTVSWSPPEDESMEPDYYHVTVQSEFENVAFDARVESTFVELSGLRTDTEYNIEITACYDDECLDRLETENTQPQGWRTEVEQWKIIGLRGEDFNPLMANASSPTLLNLSTLPIEQEGWMLTTLQDQGSYKSIHISRLQEALIVGSGDNFDLDFVSVNEGGIADLPGMSLLTSASARPIERDDDWSMQLFVSAEIPLGDRNMIGSWISNNGFDGNNSYGDGEGVCEIDLVYENCGMTTCMDTEEADLSRIDCVNIIRPPSRLADHPDLMLIQGIQDPDDTSPPNLYVAEDNRDGSWSPIALTGNIATPLLKNATSASLWTKNEYSKLYYWDEVSGIAKIRYWDPTLSGESDVLDLGDLEDDSRVRNVSYKDMNGDPLRTSEFQIMEQSFLIYDGRAFMLTTIMDANGDKHITLGILTNP